MATLSDFGRVMKKTGPFRFCYRLWGEIAEDQVFMLASALAYSWVFAIFPFMIFLLTLIPHLPANDRQRALTYIDDACRKALPKEAANTILSNVQPLLTQTRPTLLIIGIVVTIFSASGGMNATMYALDRCYEVKVGRPFYLQRPIAMVLTVIVATLVIAVSILLPIGAVVIEWMTSHHMMHPVVAWALGIARYAFAIVLMIWVLSILYHFGPGIKHRYVLISPGAIFTISMWLLLEFTFRQYVDRCASYDKTYGAVGGIAIVMLMFYVVAVVLMIGAEINSEVDFEILGVPRGTKDLRPPKTGAAKIAPGKTPAGGVQAGKVDPGKVASLPAPAVALPEPAKSAIAIVPAGAAKIDATVAKTPAADVAVPEPLDAGGAANAAVVNAAVAHGADQLPSELVSSEHAPSNGSGQHVKPAPAPPDAGLADFASGDIAVAG